MFFLFDAALYAQDNLSLSDAIQIGLKNNYQIQISGKNSDIAKRNNNWLEAGALPSISLNSSYAYNWNDNDNPASFIQGASNTSTTAYGADLNWVLFNGFSVKIRKDKLQQLQEQFEGSAAIIVENTIHAIILGYYNALLQQEKINALSNIVALATDRYQYHLEKKELGSISTFDLLQTKTAMINDSTNYLLQQLATKNAQRNLNMLMAIDVEKIYHLTDQLQHVHSLFNLAGLKEKMFSNNQTLKNQYVNRLIIKKDKALAKAKLFPVLSFGSGVNRSVSSFDGTGQGGIPISTSGNTSLSYYARFSLSFVLFDGHKSHRAFKNMQIQEEVAQLTVDEMKLDLTNQLITTYELYMSRVAILRLTQENLNANELNLKLAEERYSSGGISSFEYRDIQTAYLNALSIQLESVFNTISTHTDLTRLTGGIVEEFGSK